MKPLVMILIVSLVFPSAAVSAQSTAVHRSIDSVMTELYAAVTRPPGKPFEWNRLRAIMLPGAIMVPQQQQMQGKTRIMSTDAFIALIDSSWSRVIGTERDHGFYERQTNLVVDQYGDIAQAFTTYEKGPFEPRQVVARGINTVQLVKRDGRWFVLSITWDEENTAGPLPAKYRGR